MRILLAGLLTMVVCAGCAAPLDVPECVVVDPESGSLYISNVSTANKSYWVDDGEGFISIAQVKPGGELDIARWHDSTRRHPIHAPKGMCILDGVLWVADNTRILRFPLDGGRMPAYRMPGAVKLNDMASDGRVAFVSDTGTGRIHRLDPDGSRLVKAPPSVNGITFHKGAMFCVSWDLHEVYELDPSGKAEPRPFGLASHFMNLDGIEVLDDGTFIVSDFTGNKVCAISPDRKSVRTILEVESPADLCIDRKRGLLIVPLLLKDRIVVVELKKVL